MQQRGELELAVQPPPQWLGVPLKVNNHILGALVLKSYSKNVRFRERDKDVLTLISHQLAAAIDRKRNEQALRRSEVRYRSLVQTAVYGIYRSSLEGRFLDVNPALIGMLGYNSASDVLALDPQKDVFVEPREYARLVDEFQRTGRMDGFEVRWKRKDGATITVRISGRAVAGGDEPSDILEPSAASSKINSANLKKWKPLAASPVASLTTSTISSPSLVDTPRFSSTTSASATLCTPKPKPFSKPP